ncbi:extracellular solute-binding protein [Patescibacteria group bacterium]|nr:MAG: extracellular solute-binding protein [Patescibacteria group bacterium]
MTRPKKIFLTTVALLLTAGLGCKGASPELARATKPVALSIWGVFDDQDAYDQVINDYRVSHPYVQIQYRKLRPEEYEQELLNALAEDRGPDILMLRNSSPRAWQTKLEPMPRQVTVAELVTQGTVKKEQVFELHQKNTPSLRGLQAVFPDQVIRDAVLEVEEQTGPTAVEKVKRIYGLPLSIDTLALYWNRDLLNAKGIAEPPTDWTAIQQAVKKLTKLEGTEVVQSGVAAGTAKNVERPTDILSLLMMQNGTLMTDEGGSVAFNTRPPGAAEREFPPGIEALVFYTDFANPTKEVYNWNDSLPNSLDAFVAGKSAMFIGYQYHLPLIRARAPKLKFGVAPAPQIAGNPEVNFANYWLYAVSKKSKNKELAWDFLISLASEKEAKKYLAATGKPTALRSLIQDQIEDVNLGVFAGQILTAQSWYRGYDVAAAEQAFKDLIDQTLAGGKPEDIMSVAASRVQQTLTPKQ